MSPMFIGCEVADAEYERSKRYSRAQRPSARGVARRTAGYSTVLSLCYWTNDRQRPPGPPIAQPWPCEFGNGVGTDLPQHSWPFTRHTSVSSQLSAHSHAVSLSLNSTVSALVIYITPHKLPQAPPAGSLSCYRTTVMSWLVNRHTISIRSNICATYNVSLLSDRTIITFMR